MSIQSGLEQDFPVLKCGKDGYALHVHLMSKNMAVGIPVVQDQDKQAYKDALHKVWPNADLDR